MDKSKLQETLVNLYLRLNGYFTTGFIVHSPHYGKNKTEVDVLAVRFPNNAEPETEGSPDENLLTSNSAVDVVIGEVKSRGQSLCFNEPLNRDTLPTIFRWIGMFDECQIEDVSNRFYDAISQPPQQDPPTVCTPTICTTNDVRVRGLLFSPERKCRRYTQGRQNNQRWFLPGPHMINFMWERLCGEQTRPESSTVYDFTLWGELEPLVRYLKCQNKPPNFNELKQHFCPSD